MGVFHFKKFSVYDDHATMKVGTDAVLLGAWTNVENTNRLLDIGTGTGILSLMLAQRTPKKVLIDAVELEEVDTRQAIENVKSSPWNGKISVFHSTIQEFKPQSPYDLIICNPPFFKDSLLPPAKGRQTSRHTTTLTQDDLIDAVTLLMAAKGRFNVILPLAESEIFISKAGKQKLFLRRYTRFFTRKDKPQERSLLEFQFGNGPTATDTLTLYQNVSEWSREYLALTKEFYLDRQ